ncbi:MAG: lysoplasmalogenase [Firmicutes bacterium]|nr:lysoplasmalogenase [Bacillota bacterium]
MITASGMALGLYCALSVFECCQAERHSSFHFVKTLLMPVLTAFYLLTSRQLGKPVFPFAVLALVFGWAGDVLLLGKGDRFFLSGLISFLLGHVFYAILFVTQIAHGMTPVYAWLMIAGFMIYAAIVVRFLMPHVGSAMRIPVIAYLGIILLMNVGAALRAGSVALVSSVLVSAGAVFFMISDTILAFSVFGGRKDRGVMETYTAAQLLIITGLLFV